MSRHGLGRAALLVASVLGALALFSSAAYASGPPIVTVGSASNLTLNTATLNRTVNSNGASTTYKIEYGKSKLYGSSTPVKTLGSGSTSISEVVVGLENLATYHFRVSATNSFGTTVSEDVQFEMLLQWKVKGKPLSEPPWAEELPAFYQALPEYPSPGFHAVFKLVGNVVGFPTEVSCKVDYQEHHGHGILGSEYNMHLEGCTTKLNGVESSRCKPPDMDLKFNAVLVVSGKQPLKLGSGLCAVGNEIELGGRRLRGWADGGTGGTAGLLLGDPAFQSQHDDDLYVGVGSNGRRYQYAVRHLLADKPLTLVRGGPIRARLFVG